MSIQALESEENLVFYHLSIKKNHNFMVENVIAHNMQIYIKTLSGRKITLDVQPSDSVMALKVKIFSKEKIPIKNQRLLYAGKLI